MVPSLEPGIIFAGDYRIIRKLNSGGMGDIYLVEQLSVNSTRALKLMKPQPSAIRIYGGVLSRRRASAPGLPVSTSFRWSPREWMKRRRCRGLPAEYLEGDSLSTVLAQRERSIRPRCARSCASSATPLVRRTRRASSIEI